VSMVRAGRHFWKMKGFEPFLAVPARRPRFGGDKGLGAPFRGTLAAISGLRPGLEPPRPPPQGAAGAWGPLLLTPTTVYDLGVSGGSKPPKAATIATGRPLFPPNGQH
jgi:hypothetical protein